MNEYLNLVVFKSSQAHKNKLENLKMMKNMTEDHFNTKR